MRTVRAWRIAWRTPAMGWWKLGMYQYTDRTEAEAAARYLGEWIGAKTMVIPCSTFITDHGINS